jgi:hypothetical protein
MLGRLKTTVRFRRPVVLPAVGVWAAVADAGSPRHPGRSKTIAAVLREPLPPEELRLTGTQTGFVIRGPTFAYRADRNTGGISGIQVERDGQEVVTASGPAELKDPIFLAPAAPGIHPVLVAGQPAEFFFDPVRGLAFGTVTFAAKPLKLEVLCSAAGANQLPEMPVTIGPLALHGAFGSDARR